jgi:uncharacterized delta-60 repeat protein
MRILRVLLLVPALLALFAGAALAKSPPTRPARLDPSYGLDGSYAVATGKAEGYEAQHTHLALAKDGEAYVLRGTALTAFTPAGKPDHSFGKNGRVRVEVGPGKLKALAGIAVDSQGRVLVGGTYEPFPGYVDRVVKGAPKYPASVEATEAVVVRYLPDGSLDPSFGSGGVAISALGVPLPTDKPANGGPPSVEYERPTLTVSKLLVDAQDRPVLGGKYMSAIEWCGYANGYTQSFVGRLTSSGTLDTSFANSGYQKARDNELTDLAAAREGQVAVISDQFDHCGEHNSSPSNWTTSVLDENGLPSPELDPARPQPYGASNLTVDGRGDLIYDRWENNTGLVEPGAAIVVRLLPNGDYDTSFGSKGGANLKQFKFGSLPGIAVDDKNRPIVAFGTEEPGLIRLTTAGKVDHTFAKKGVLRAKVQRVAKTTPEAIAIDSKGRIVVAGNAEGGSLKTGWGISVTRFLPN